jgi:hypothetical protein
MPAKNPRLTAVVEKPLYQWLKKSAQKEGISVSLRIRDLLREARELEEDQLLARIGEERMKTFDRRTALTHEEVWGKRK